MNLLYRGGPWGQAVAEWQRLLEEAGHDPGPVDGHFGPRTDAATRAFQRATGCTADGIVGPQTRAAMAGVLPGDLPVVPEYEPLEPPPGLSWQTPLALQYWPASRIREALVASYWSVLGLQMYRGSPSRETFLELVGPDWANGVPMDFDAKQQIWTCAMTVEGCLERLRVDCPSLLRPAHVAEAGSRSRVYAQQCHAHITPNATTRPEPGDIYYVGPANIQHWRGVLGWEGDVCVTVNGGNVDPVHNRQCVKLSREPWVKRWGAWVEAGDSQWHKTWAWYDVSRFGWRDEPRLLPV